jgi:DNA-binding transcriptional MerR regulator
VPNPRWSQEEEEALEFITMNRPPHLINRLYNRWASRSGHVKRSALAIKLRIRMLGIDRTTGDIVSASYVRKTLGVSPKTAQGWTDRGLLPDQRDKRNRRYFKRSEICDLARKHPMLFAGISADRLFMLLEDRELADEIAISHPWRTTQSRAVIAVEKRWRYATVQIAAAAVGVSRTAIYSAINRGTRSAGYHWSYIP